jgi:single-strand DNA-binding protein
MAGEAQISFSGFVHKDPELRFTPGGDAVASISVKVTPFKRGQDGSGKRGDPSWYRVSVWGKAGEAVAERVREGDRVNVTGTLEMRAYEKDGQKRVTPEVRAETVGMIPSMDNKETTTTIQTEIREPW